MFNHGEVDLGPKARTRWPKLRISKPDQRHDHNGENETFLTKGLDTFL